MGYVADRWHKTKPKPGEPECGEHKGKVASKAHGKGKRWQARYDGPDGHERTALFKTQAEATTFVQEQETALRHGSWIDPDAGAVTVQHFAEKVWLPAQAVNERTLREYAGVVRRYLVPELGALEVRAVKPSAASKWQADLKRKYNLAPGYQARIVRMIHGLFHAAVRDKLIHISPFDGIRGPAIPPSDVNPPDLIQVKLMIAAAYRRLWAVMLETDAQTGLRSGELRGLTVDRIDWLRKTARIDRQIVYMPGKGLYLDDLKTPHSRRTLPLHDRTVSLLAAWVKENPPPTSGEYAGLLFRMPDGRPVSESTADWAYKSICGKAGVPEGSWHQLRHHYASVLIAGGESPKVVQKRLGHKDVATTLRIYTHLWAEAEERTRSVLDAAWEEDSSRRAEGSRNPGQLMVV